MYKSLENKYLWSYFCLAHKYLTSNFKVGWAIILKFGICEPNKNTIISIYSLKTYTFIHLVGKGLRLGLPNFANKFSAQFIYLENFSSKLLNVKGYRMVEKKVPRFWHRRYKGKCCDEVDVENSCVKILQFVLKYKFVL